MPALWKIPVMFVAAVILNPSYAAGKNVPMMSYGEANVSCGTFVEYRNDPVHKQIFLAWLNGYFTAVNKYDANLKVRNGSHDIKAGRDSDSIMLWLDNYCRANPLNSFIQGTLALQNELKK